jgi:HD-like signal output (HDOD) protein
VDTGSSNEVTARLVQHLRGPEIAVPPYPAIAAAIAKLAVAEQLSIDKLVDVVKADPAFAATVLRHASVASRRNAGPATLDAAIWKLGADELVRLALLSNFGAAATTAGPLALLRREVWGRALLAAHLAQELAGRRGVAPDVAFLAGLLHDFGAVVAIASIERLSGIPTLSKLAWRYLVDDVHLEVGLVVAARWGLPEPIAEVISRHHEPQTSSHENRPLVQLIAVVDQVIAELEQPDGVAATEIPGLDHDERYRLAAVVARVAEQLATYERPPERDVPCAITFTRQNCWPCDLSMSCRGVAFRAHAITPDTLTFRGRQRLEPGWLAEISLETESAPLTMLVNVQECERLPDGDHEIVAKPFALDGPPKEAWQRLVATARASSKRTS